MCVAARESPVVATMLHRAGGSTWLGQRGPSAKEEKIDYRVEERRCGCMSVQQVGEIGDIEMAIAKP
jgi:hypothetical protein